MKNKFTITTPQGSRIEMELGQEVDLTLTDKKTGKEKNILISIYEIEK